MEIFSQIVGTGRALPGNAVTNAELAQRLATSGVETSDDWIRERTGIAQRHIASDDVFSSDLATQAAQQALQMAGVDVSQVDLVIVATSTPDMIFPSTACLVQKKPGHSTRGGIRCPGGLQRLCLRALHGGSLY